MSKTPCQQICQIHQLLQLDTLYVLYEHFTKSPLIDHQKNCYLCSDPETAELVSSRFGRYQTRPNIRPFSRDEIPQVLHMIVDLLGTSIQYCTPEHTVKLEQGFTPELSFMADRNTQLLFLLTIFMQEQRMRNRMPEQYGMIQHYHDEIQKALRHTEFLLPAAREQILHTLNRLGEIAIPFYTDSYHLQQKYPDTEVRTERCAFRRLLTMPTEHFIINSETVAYQLDQHEIAKILRD